MGGCGFFFLSESAVGLTHSMRPATRFAPSSSSPADASRKLSIWRVWAFEPLNSGLPVVLPPFICGRVHWALLAIVYSVGLNMNFSSEGISGGGGSGSMTRRNADSNPSAGIAGSYDAVPLRKPWWASSRISRATALVVTSRVGPVHFAGNTSSRVHAAISVPAASLTEIRAWVRSPVVLTFETQAATFAVSGVIGRVSLTLTYFARVGRRWM